MKEVNEGARNGTATYKKGIRRASNQVPTGCIQVVSPGGGLLGGVHFHRGRPKIRPLQGSVWDKRSETEGTRQNNSLYNSER